MANSRNMEEPKELFSWKEGERNFWSTNAVSISIVILTGGQKSSFQLNELNNHKIRQIDSS